jgi:hypothetical protein
VDQLREHLLRVLERPYFPDWLWISVGVIALALLYRSTFRKHLQTGKPPGLAALAVLAAFFTVVSRRAVPTGDEPHYLIMTQSLLRDGDFDLRNNYQNQDYRAYYPDAIPDPHIIVAGERWYPVHAIGLPILAAPVYAVGGRIAVVGLLTLMTVAGLRVLWSALCLAGFESRVIATTSLVVGLTLPVAVMAGQVFPEVPAFLLVALVLRAIIAPVPSDRDWLGFLLGLGILPWLHPKYALLGGALLLSMTLVHHRQVALARFLAAISVLVASVAGHALLSYQWYGAPLPGASILVTSGVSPSGWLPAIIGHFLVHPWVGLFGVLFDQQSGLFFAAPVYLLAIGGFVLLWQRARNLAVASGLIVASVYLLAGSYGIWYGGYSSPARLLTPTIPVLALGLASLLQSGDRKAWRLFWVLAVLSFFHGYLMTAFPSFTRYGDPSTNHNFFVRQAERIFGLDLTPIFPSFRHPMPITWVTTTFYVLGIGALTATLVHRVGKAASPSISSTSAESEPA